MLVNCMALGPQELVPRGTNETQEIRSDIPVLEDLGPPGIGSQGPEYSSGPTESGPTVEPTPGIHEACVKYTRMAKEHRDRQKGDVGEARAMPHI